MRKASSILVLLLSITMACFLVVKTYARPITSSERRFYAQNNIIFYVPGEEEKKEEEPEPGDPLTPSGSGAALIASTARALAWPTSNGKCRNLSGEYVDWLPKNNEMPADCMKTVNDLAKSKGFSDGRSLQDCGTFVGYVLRSTVDKSAKQRGTYSQADYFDSQPSKWKKVSTDGQEFSIANLNPGDVLVAWEARDKNALGHIIIWIGDMDVDCARGEKKCRVNVASASQDTRTPSLKRYTNVRYEPNSKLSIPYIVYRYIGN